MEWEFEQDEECYYINYVQHKVEKSRARHSLRGRILDEELYEMRGCARGSYHQPYKTSGEATDALKKNLKFRIGCLQERLQELEAL